MLSEANQARITLLEEVASITEVAPLSFEWYDVAGDPAGWDEEISRLNQNVFHRSAMLRAHQPTRSFQRGVLILQGGRLMGALGGLLLPCQAGGAFRTMSFPLLNQGLHPDTPRLLTDWLLSQGMTRIHFGSFDGGVEGFTRESYDRVEERLEFIYDVTLSEEQRRLRVNSNHRRKLKKAESKAMRLRRIEHLQPWIMTWLNSIWSRRHGNPFTPKRMLQTLAYYHTLTRLLRNDKSANLYGLYDGSGRILSMAYMLERGTTAFYMIGASSDEGYQCGASVRLMWELAREYPRFGIRTMNLGGVPIAARGEQHGEFGVYRFKAGFGIEPTLRQSLIIEA